MSDQIDIDWARVAILSFGFLIGLLLGILSTILVMRSGKKKKFGYAPTGAASPSRRRAIPTRDGKQNTPNLVGATPMSRVTKDGPNAGSGQPIQAQRLSADVPEPNAYSVEADVAWVRPEPVVDAPKELYFPAPRWDGSFETRNGRSAYKDGESMYKAVVIGPTEARFELLNQRIVLNKALNTPDACLDPVCDGNRQYGRDYQAIVTDVAGTLRLEGDVWVLVNKAKISYR